MINIKSKKLSNFLQEIPDDRIFLRSHRGDVSYGNVKRLVSQFEDDHDYLKGKRCAIKSSSRFGLAVYLPCIENLTGSLFLQPENIVPNDLEAIYDLTKIDYCIHILDDDVKIEKINGYEAQANDGLGWILTTSGTTGTPKVVSYSLESLAKSTKRNAAEGTKYIWGLSYDLNRFAGLQVYLQAIAAGSTLVISESAEAVGDVVYNFKLLGVNALSATASFWRKILMSPFSSDMPFKLITLGGEIADQNTLNALSQKYPSAKIVHIYASTEAGVGFSVKDRQAGFPVSFLKDDYSTSMKLKVYRNTLWIKKHAGKCKIIRGQVESDINDFYNTGDIVSIENNRVLFKGRESGSINVGGNKVMPEEVELILNNHPLIALSHVFGKKNAILGMLVSAKIILDVPEQSGDCSKLKKQIKDYCRKQLETYKVPAFIECVDSINLNDSGKINRN